MDDTALHAARGIALKNALEHDGKTNVGLVMSKLLGEVPELRSQASEVAGALGDIIKEVNAMTPESQRAQLESDHAERMAAGASKSKDDGNTLPALDGAVKGKVVTRFPPEPSGYPHIGHAKAAIINTEYARMYDGKCILRLDDTNPESERLEYYAAIKVGLEWLGLEFDTIKNTSDDMEQILDKGKSIINSGGAYVCTCKKDDISASRREMRACACSKKDTDEHVSRWEKMFSKYAPGEAIVRYRGDIASKNTTMRDPALFRIIDVRHPLLGNKYRVWPSYDFAVAVEDSLDGVTHAFRSKEFEMRSELYASLLATLGMRAPMVDVFSRLDIEGMPVSKRLIRPLIESGDVSWYDDPRLPTLEAMKRRGIRPEAIKQFILSLGFTKADTMAPFATLESLNRKVIDPTSSRLHMVRNAHRINVVGLPESVSLANHPGADLGERKIALGDGALLVEESDAHDADALWLIGLGNVRITREGGQTRGEYVDSNIDAGNAKVQWVPEHGSHEITIMVPGMLFKGGEYDPHSMTEEKALVESRWAELKDTSMIQFVRYGYCKKESSKAAVFTHK